MDIDGRPAAALIDSGASHSFLNTAYVKSAGWKLLPTAEAAALLGSGDLSAPIDGVTIPISCARSAVHFFRVMPLSKGYSATLAVTFLSLWVSR